MFRNIMQTEMAVFFNIGREIGRVAVSQIACLDRAAEAREIEIGKEG
ncbi:MAG: hypothetical protein IBX68_06200 [Dehalococcoidia bacterium]|nr:hypothetical protein [Dehalococcoidia bacterium]